ncbi:RDD family protein, partial [Frankia tisae]|uniref:RDD family protein n=1 Tax=Frankia tisae TaxID=2950104 RepID=UPI0021C00C5C
PGQYQQPGQYPQADQYPQPGQYQQPPPGQYPQPGQYQQPGYYQPNPYPQPAPGYGPGQPVGPGAYASWGQRVGAYLIDTLPQIVVLGLFGAILRGPAVALLVILWLALLGWVIYNRWIQGGRTGQTLGKKTLNIRLVSEVTGQPIGPAMALARDLCHCVDGIICYVGFLFPLWDAKRQTLADKIVHTVVVPA